ncbi:DUF86 domain-containing protein [Nitrosomonas sp.]|uniref:type VII toxin-antitoxin system HepT family RNase toxin n=1 Tax=Nitrosomonas sp. TaxID=42353 RepID=UPI0025FBD297|nr:DUF86 domain-containing protein [Nitrosomonas sp.]
MDTTVLTEKLESLRRCVQRIEEKQPRHIDELKQSIDLQDILVLNLTRAIQLCVDIGSHLLSQTNCPAPRTMGSVFTLLQEANIISPTTSQQLKKAIGFRNIAVHQYEAINWEIVYAISQRALRIFANSHGKSATMPSCNSLT